MFEKFKLNWNLQTISFNMMYNMSMLRHWFSNERWGGAPWQRWFLATRFLSEIFVSEIFVSEIFVSEIFISKIFISRILYLGYHIHEINSSDMTGYLCQFVG